MKAAEDLHAWAVSAARAPVLYEAIGVPDTVDGRFEVLTAHVLLLVERLKSEDAAMTALRQQVFDVYISHLDGAMREMGVGDLAMGKRMRKLGEAIYGRARAYDDAFATLPDRSALEGLLQRTVLGSTGNRSAAGLAHYILERRSALRRCADAALCCGVVDLEVVE